MTKIMPETKQQLRYQWIRPIIDREISIKDVLKVSPFSERTIKYWLARFKEDGTAGLIDKSTRPHSFPNQTPSWIEERIAQIREDKGIGGKKIFWELEKEGILIGERIVSYVLKRKGLTRVYRHKREYIYRKRSVTVPGELLEIDIKYGIHFGFDRWWYQYTAIDIASKWRYLLAFENRQNDYSLNFLKMLLE